HIGQVRVSGHRGLQDRWRQAWPASEGRHADRERSDRPQPYWHDRKRLRTRSRHWHLRQEWPGGARRCGATYPAHGPTQGGRNRISSRPQNLSLLAASALTACPLRLSRTVSWPCPLRTSSSSAEERGPQTRERLPSEETPSSPRRLHPRAPRD